MADSPPSWRNRLELLSTDRRLCYFSAGACWWLTNGFKTLHLCQHRFQTAAPPLSEINGPFGSAAGGSGVFGWEWFPESHSWSCSISLVRFGLCVLWLSNDVTTLYVHCISWMLSEEAPYMLLWEMFKAVVSCFRPPTFLRRGGLSAGSAKIMWCISFLYFSHPSSVVLMGSGWLCEALSHLLLQYCVQSLHNACPLCRSLAPAEVFMLSAWKNSRLL